MLLASGKTVAISTLRKGQKVLATDTRAGTDKAETGIAVLVRHDHDLYDLKVRAGGRTAVIDTTRSHLFWDPDSRRWVKAAALKYGSHLRTPSGGTATVLGGHAPRNTSGWMWDLTITPSHDFYVKAAATAILVHNVDGCGNAVSEYDTVPYRPSSSPLENHHGIPDVWAKNNITGYVSRAADNPTMALARQAIVPPARFTGIGSPI